MKDSKIIIGVISDHCRVTMDQLKSESVDRRVTKARQLIFYFMRSYTKLYLRTIGSFLNKDHSTVSVAYNTVRDLSNIYPDYRQEVESIRRKIENKLGSDKKVIIREYDILGRVKRHYEEEVFMEPDYFKN